MFAKKIKGIYEPLIYNPSKFKNNQTKTETKILIEKKTSKTIKKKLRYYIKKRIKLTKL